MNFKKHEEPVAIFTYAVEGKKAVTIIEIDEGSDLDKLEKDFIETLDDNAEYIGYRLAYNQLI